MLRAMRLFPVTSVTCAAVVLSAALLFTTCALAQQAPTYWQAHTPLIEGDDVSGDNSQYHCTPGNTLYKCQFKGSLYGHWNEGSNVPDTHHDTYGRNLAQNSIFAKCPL